MVNFELPNISEDYVHRIGRTGRAGSEGVAISLVCVDELQYLKDIEKLIKRKIPQERVAGFEPDPTIRPEPVKKKSNSRNRNRPKPSREDSKPSSRSSRNRRRA